MGQDEPHKVFKNFQKVITVAAKNLSNNMDPIDLSVGVTEIKACLRTNDFDGSIAGGEVVVLGDGHTGKFTITISSVTTNTFEEGRDIMDFQIEFGASQDPIIGEFPIDVIALPC